jgi:PAS domain S-box-containing protein
MVERDRAIGGLYRRLNTEVEAIGASRIAMQERQQQLALAERYLAAVLDHAPQALLSTDLEGVIVTCNQVATDLFDFPAGDCAGLHLPQQFAAESRSAVSDAMRQARGGRSVRSEARIERPSAKLTVELALAPVLGLDGRVTALSAAILDITERKQMEAALAETNRRLNAVLNNATVAIFLMDDRQHCAYMNEAAERLTGFRWEETQGRPLHDVIHHTRPDGSHYPREECPIDRAFPNNRQEQGEDVFVHKDGHFYPVAFTASPIHDDDSRTVGTIIEVRDITEQRRAQQARELLMREVDHRARNVLSVAQSMIQLTQAPHLEGFKEALLGRISALARAQSSLSETAWQGGQLKTIVCDELETFGRAGGYEVTGPEIMLRPEQVQPLSMIVHELATNAAKHGALSVSGGFIHVRWAPHSEGGFLLEWEEEGGPAVTKPSRRGFGSRLILSLAKQLGATTTFKWREHGLLFSLRVAGDAA